VAAAVAAAAAAAAGVAPDVTAAAIAAAAAAAACWNAGAPGIWAPGLPVVLLNKAGPVPMWAGASCAGGWTPSLRGADGGFPHGLQEVL
jgi:hypothetical protein